MPRQTAEVAVETNTRDRILDVALDLFIEKGFDKTSLREIAEQLGFSKAALYYHFASKGDILMALHQRLHELGREAIGRFSAEPIGVDSWEALLDQLVDDMLANRKIFVMHQRNQAAFEHLHEEKHDEEHEDLQELFRRLLADPAIPLRDRVRMSCALGSIITSLMLAGDVFSEVPSEELGDMLREVVRDVLGHGRKAPRRPAGSVVAKNGVGATAGGGRVKAAASSARVR